MATITKQTIKVDLTPGRVYPVLHVSQGDVGLEALEFYVYQNGQPYPIPSEVTAINIDGMTPVGVFSYACTWTGNVVTAGLTATMTAERGIDICELALYDATNNKIGTCNFVIAVEESPYTNAHVSTSDMATIMAAASSAQQYELLAKSWAVGDTGIRTGEDTNNSKYWAEQSETCVDLSKSWAVGGTGERAGEDVNNSKYYADQSRIEGNGLASVFSTLLDYYAGDYVIHGGILYRFTQKHTAGAWSGTDAEVVNLADYKIDKTWYKYHGLSDFGRLLSITLPVPVSYAEDITYDTTRNLFYVGTRDTSGGEYLSEIIAINASTLQTVNTYYYTFGTIGNLSYNPDTDQIYVSLTGTGGYRLYSIDADTMESQGVLTTNTFSVGVQYDADNQINVALQLSGTTAEVRTYDSNFDLINTYTVAISSTDTPQQGFAVRDGKVYVPTWNSLLEIDYLNGTVNRINLAGYAPGNLEPEGFCFIEDTLYMIGVYSGRMGFAEIYQYGLTSANNAEVERIYNTVFADIKDLYSTYTTLFQYVSALPAFTKAFLYSYNPTDIFTDLPTLPDSSSVTGITHQISIVKPSYDPAFTQIELEINRVSGTDIRKRWRGVILLSSSTAINWNEYATNEIVENIKDVYSTHTTLFDYVVAMPIGAKAILYGYNNDGTEIFTDLPSLYNMLGTVIQISVTKPRNDIAYTQIELEINRTGDDIWKRWRGIIKLSTSTSITWAEYEMTNPYALGRTITSGSNLNDFTSPGVYAVVSSSTASNISNMPVAASGRLEVRETIDNNGTYIVQTYYRGNTQEAAIYHRVKTSAASGFGAWKQVAYV